MALHLSLEMPLCSASIHEAMGFRLFSMVSCTFEITVLCGLKEQPFSLASGWRDWQVLLALGREEVLFSDPQ